ncbi:MAG: hypothetical protein WC803_04040 [Sphingomonas sp.]|jgi:hypothetical protein
MSDNVSTLVTPSLHPNNVKEIDGYDEQTALVLAPTVTAFDTAYQAVIAVSQAREAAKTNPTWNEAQQRFNDTRRNEVLVRVGFKWRKIAQG